MKMNIGKSIGSVTLLCILFTCLNILDSKAQEANHGVPENYNLIYQQDFEDFRSVNDFVFSEPDYWSIRKAGGNSFLDYRKGKTDKTSPENIALLVWRRLENYIVEFDVMLTEHINNEGKFILIYNFIEPDISNQIILTNNEIRVKEEWVKVKLKRNISEGLIEVYIDGKQESHIIESGEVKDKGWPGFASFSASLRIDNIKIWAPGKLEAWRPRCFPSKPAGKIQNQPDINDSSFKSIFNGKTLDGWKPLNGSAFYSVANGEIIGECNPEAKRNTYLSTEKSYANFILAFEVKYEKPGNSGIQIRSRQRERDGLVTGYQIEIDQSERKWTGGFYEERGRGWFSPLAGDYNIETREAFRLSEWNLMVIKADGNHFQTWVNGVPIADFYDMDEEFAASEGFIGLQVHWPVRPDAIGKLRWKNLRIKELD